MSIQFISCININLKIGNIVHDLGRSPDAACIAIAGPITEFGTVV